MKVLIVDLDNTLFDTRARYNACLAQQGVASLDSLQGEARRKFCASTSSKYSHAMACNIAPTSNAPTMRPGFPLIAAIS